MLLNILDMVTVAGDKDYVYSGKGDGTFDAPVSYAVGIGSSSVSLGDGSIFREN